MLDASALDQGYTQPTEDGDAANMAAVPAAGADFTYTVQRAMRLRMVSALFTASGNAANRIPALKVQIRDSVVAYIVPVATAITAGQAVQVTFGKSLPAIATSTAQTQTVPEIYLPRGAIVSSVTGAINATDQWSNVAVIGIYCD